MLSLFHHLHCNSNADNISPDVGVCYNGISNVLTIVDSLEEVAREKGDHNKYMERNSSVVSNADMWALSICNKDAQQC